VTADVTTAVRALPRLRGKLARRFRTAAASESTGLLGVVTALVVALAVLAPTHVEAGGAVVNAFWNAHTLIQVATDTSFIAIMAVGATLVIASGGIDLSVGAIYALAGVTMGLAGRAMGPLALAPGTVVMVSLIVALGVGSVAGLLNGIMIVELDVHPFIITLGTMWVLRGIAFVVSRAESILVPPVLTTVAKSSLGLPRSLAPVPLLVTLVVTMVGSLYLDRTVMGRHILAVGGNAEASRLAGVPVGRVRIGVYVVSGVLAGLASALGGSFYGAVSSADGTGYELYVIASAVVGGASLSGGSGRVVNGTLGALLIVLIRQAIRTLQFDQNWEWVVVGCAIVIAVAIDRWSGRIVRRVSDSTEHST
jgi:ribose/xylose/arabinose/galactoside ABC-type transport system permease subunit